MHSDCRGRLQHKRSFGFVQNAETNRASRMLRHPMRKIKPSYILYLPTCLQERASGRHLIFIRGTLPLT